MPLILDNEEVEEYLPLNKDFRSSPCQQGEGDSVKRRRCGEQGQWGGEGGMKKRQDAGHGGEALVLTLS